MSGKNKNKTKLNRITKGFLGVSTVALVVVVVAGIGAMLRPVNSDAYGVFSGVESVVANKVLSGENYKVLEVVPDGSKGEFGYLVAGSEPDMLQNELTEYLQQRVEDFDNKKENRISYMENLATELRNAGIVGDDDNVPMKYTTYAETYFPTEEQKKDMGVVYFPEGKYEKASLVGEYVINENGTGQYRANVLNFQYSTAGDYAVEFTTVKQSEEYPYCQPYEYNSSGYYVPVEQEREGARYFYVSEYTYQGTAAASSEYVAVLNLDKPYSYTREGGDYDFVPAADQSIDPGETPPVQEDTPAGENTPEAGENAPSTEANVPSTEANVPSTEANVPSTEANVPSTEENISSTEVDVPSTEGNIPSTDDTVSGSAVDVESNGGGQETQGATTPEGGAQTGGETSTTPENPSGSENSNNGMKRWDVEIGQVYYTGGFVNKNWFKTKVLCAAEDANFDVEVVTVTETELAATDVSNFDFVYICGDTLSQGHKYGVTTGGARVDTSSAVYALMTRVKDEFLPLMIDGQVWNEAKENDTTSDVYTLVNLIGGVDTAKESIYCTPVLDIRAPFFDNLEFTFSTETDLDKDDGYQSVREMIHEENLLRTEAEKLDTNLTKVTVLQYIINFSNKRVFAEKSGLKVLDIEPAWGREYDNANSTNSQVLTPAKVEQLTGISADAVEIVHMTTGEFIGKTEDLNTTYDMVYIGLGYSNDYMNRDSSGKTVYNDSHMNGMVYTHVGDAIIRSPYIAGLLDTDYVNNDRSMYLYGPTVGASNDAFGYRTVYDETLGKMVTTLKTLSNYNYSDPQRFGTSNWNNNSSNLQVGNVGVYRFPGNDITNTKMKDLEEYVGAKYPVFFAEGFMNENGSLNDSVIDNSSILYEFMQKNVQTDNVFFIKQEDSSYSVDKTENLSYFVNMPKILLTFYDQQNNPVLDETAPTTGTRLDKNNNYGNKIVEVDTSLSSRGIYTLRMKFKVDSSVNTSTSTMYRAKLYLDMNADGKFIDNDSYSEVQRDILIQDATGREASTDESGEYVLTSGNVYTLEKEISSDYRGILTWKLELCQTTNEYVRTSKIGYTVVSGNSGEVEVARVLQISGCTQDRGRWVIGEDSDMRGFVNDYAASDGIRFEFSNITANQFMSNIHSFDDLKQYDMLIFGFQDSYTDINAEDALDALDAYINSGRSVLFTHDNSSFVNVSDPNQYVYDTADQGAYWMSGQDLHPMPNNFQPGEARQTYWGYNINARFRNILGMDRFGITYNENLDSNSSYAENRYNLLKQGQLVDLSKNVNTSTNTVESYTGTIDTVNGGKATSGTLSAQLGTDKDIAYVAGSNRTQAYGESQGYSLGSLNFGYTSNGGCSVYGYNIYNNLRVTVNQGNWWENLGQIYNNYAVQLNDGQITHYPYEIGEMIQVTDTHAQWWQLNLDEDLDADGESDIVVWYTLTSGSNQNGYDSVPEGATNVYTTMPNDASNNYYIYSIGNIMYSGVGDYTVNRINEKKLFFNTIVAAYKLGIKNPSVTALSGSERTADEASAIYIPTDVGADETILDDEVTFYYTVSDPNLVTSVKTITAEYYLGTDTKGTKIPVTDLGNGGLYITTRAVSNTKLDASEDTGKVSGLRSGNVYEATLHNVSAENLDTIWQNNKFNITIHVCSAFNYYGIDYGQGPNDKSSPEAVTTVDFVKMSLFDLR